MAKGNLTIGVIKEEMVVRVGPKKHKAALKMAGAKPFVMTGKPMSGWMTVSQKGYSTNQALENWISLALEFLQTLPPK